MLDASMASPDVAASTTTAAATVAEVESHWSALDVVAGGLAGFSEHTAMFPFDTLKTRIQQHNATCGTRLGMIESARVVIREERFAHLYRGCVPVVASAVPAHGVYFAAYEAAKRFQGECGPVQHAIAAAVATTGHDLVSVPFDVVKQRMQVDKSRQFHNSMACARHVLRHEGPRAFFVSLPTTIMMNVPQIATHWVVYEACKNYLVNVRGEEEDELAWHFVASGFLAGASAAVVSAPLDVIKTQLQLGQSMGAVSSARALMAQGGMRSMFAGVVPRVCFMAPSAAIVMSVYETSKFMLEPLMGGK